MHRPGIEPGPPAWQASILPLNHRCELKRAVVKLVCSCAVKINHAASKLHSAMGKHLYDLFIEIPKRLLPFTTKFIVLLFTCIIDPKRVCLPFLSF